MPSPLPDNQVEILSTCAADLLLAYYNTLPETHQTAVFGALETLRRTIVAVQLELHIR